ncbi:MAG: FAD-dependent oxidoreductase [bacterium]|nr:FAD-dependent oxidoreductase [bacterium]
MLRDEQIKQLKETHFDLVVVGGGATGSGIALDAATRGLKVALVERDDFAAGTSSRSTKLIHGGVRYLEQAVKKFDKEQYQLVKEALHERATLIKLAPHLSHPIALVTPIYSWFAVPYFRIGLKIYDWLAGKKNLNPSKYLSAKAAKKNFPLLKAKGLRGGVLYYDGQFDDARMNVSIALTALEKGAVLANHTEVIQLLKKDNRLHGVRVKDLNTQEEFDIRGKVVVNATGPFTDTLRKMEDPEGKPILRASSGVHIVLDKRFSPPATGLLIPKTEDNRVLFLLPWLGHTLVGTTDNPAKVEKNPRPSEEDIQYILRHLKKYFDVPVSRADIQAAWSGLRPLVSDPKASDTARLSRDHVIHVGPSGLLTITGGKWTTYRKMALDAVDHAIELGELKPTQKSQTEKTVLRGGEGYSGQLSQALIQDFSLDRDVAIHLARAYGSHAPEVARLAREGYGKRLVAGHPYLEAEVLYAVEHELALTAVDILARRTRLTFLDAPAAKKALPKVLDLMAHLLGWDTARRQVEEARFFRYLDHAPSAEMEPPEKKTA